MPVAIPALFLSGLMTTAQGADDPQQLLAKDLEARAKLEAVVDGIQRDPAASGRVADAGKRRTILCTSCHGQQGISTRPEIPNLAGQNAVYLLDQFQRFGDGRRYNSVMSGLAGSFSDEDKILLSIYYSELPAGTSGGGSPEQIARGQALFAEHCQKCHGADGRGQQGYARLAGQKPQYVVNMLQQFREGGKNRSNPWMTAAAIRLDEQATWDVAYFIANLP